MADHSTTLVLDNGSHSIKAGFADGIPRTIPNCYARDRHNKTYISSQLSSCTDFAEIQLRRPLEHGFIVNWETQKLIWDRELFSAEAPQRCDPSDTRLVLTEAPNAFPILQTNIDQIVFEEYRFCSLYRDIGPSFNAYLDVQSILQTSKSTSTNTSSPAEAMLVIDCGYAHTTVTPLILGRPVNRAVRRLDVGGNLMTHYLTRLLSLRHFDMRTDTWIVNKIKEAACFVSQDFSRDLEMSWKGTRDDSRSRYTDQHTIVKDYILPDFHTVFEGRLIDYDPTFHQSSRPQAGQKATDSALNDIITLRNERFLVPELLFHPEDGGIRQCGLPDLVLQSLDAVPIGLWPALLANTLVVGGGAKIPGLIQRLQAEITQRAPDVCTVRVGSPADSVLSTWAGAANLAVHPDIETRVVTRQEYDEHGSVWVSRKFSSLPTT